MRYALRLNAVPPPFAPLAQEVVKKWMTYPLMGLAVIGATYIATEKHIYKPTGRNGTNIERDFISDVRAAAKGLKEEVYDATFDTLALEGSATYEAQGHGTQEGK